MKDLVFSRIGAAQLLSLLADDGSGWTMLPTARFAAQGIDGGSIEAWTARKGGRICARLLLARRLADRDFADGQSRCYLYCFTVEPALRGQGIGTALLRHVLDRAASLGFREACIGVSQDKPENMRLYRREGFTKLVKTASYDPCTPLPDGTPCPDSFLLLSRPLYEE